MPTFRDITVSLQSQYDALTIPAQVSLSSPGGHRNASFSALDLSSAQLYNLSVIKQSGSPAVEVCIPTFPSSQFWISYSCEPPGMAFTNDDVRFYYFKLFVSGKCILSWGVGEQDDWCGKAMYALYHAGTDFDGRKVIQKRGLFFPKDRKGYATSGFEIRVFRAKARKREPVKYETFKASSGDQAAFDLKNLGRVKKGEPQRMYTYALIDPKDEPHVTFRYTIRSVGTETIYELPCEIAGSQIEHHAVSLHRPLATNQEKQMIRRLSVPPRRKLVSSSTRVEPSSPIKRKAIYSDNDPSNEETEDAQIKPRRDWVNRTPPPMVSRLFDRPASPSSRSRKGGTTGLLKNMVTNALKKREDKEWERDKNFLV